MVPELAEVFPAQAEQGGPVELGVPADVIVHFRLEAIPVPVKPLLRREVLPAHEDRRGLPVVSLPREERPALEPEDLQALGGKRVTERATPSASADDDNVVMLVVRHAGPLLELSLIHI